MTKRPDLRKALAQLPARSGRLRLGIGLSGGRDSTALVRLLAALDPRPALVGLHLDHALRPDSGDQARFVRRLGAELGIPVVERREDVAVRARESRRPVEEAGRLARLDFFAREAQERDLDAVAVAHTRSDQAETLLLQLARGAGGLGLSAMPVVRTGPRGFRLFRPLLGVPRAELAALAEAEGWECYADPWNEDDRFARVRVRKRVLPCLEEELNPQAERALARTARLLRDDEAWLAEAARARFEELAGGEDPVRLPVRALAGLHPGLARRVLREAIRSARGHLRRIELVHVEAVWDLVRTPRRGASLDLPGVVVRIEERGDRTLIVAARPV